MAAGWCEQALAQSVVCSGQGGGAIMSLGDKFCVKGSSIWEFIIIRHAHLHHLHFLQLRYNQVKLNHIQNIRDKNDRKYLEGKKYANLAWVGLMSSAAASHQGGDR